MVKRVKIYVASHKPIEKYGDECYQLIHVGAAQHEDVNIVGAVKDDYNPDNISSKNDIYCELTALYYVWKNVHDIDVTGLVHYRRFFTRNTRVVKNPNDIILTQEEILDALCEKDIILGSPSKKKYAVGGFFTNPLDVPEFAIYRNILPSIKLLYPEYVEDYYKEFFEPTMSFCNMMICKKDLFDQYCEFLFNILFDAEKRWKAMGIGIAPREMGYISEYILNCWIRHQKQLKICYKPIMLFEDTSKIGFKVHFLLGKLGLQKLNPMIDKVYARFIKK